MDFDSIVNNGFAHAYLVKVQRDVRAAELTASIQKPDRHLYELMLDANDQEALEIAIERSRPDQLAKWILNYITGANGFEDEDADEDEE